MRVQRLLLCVVLGSMVTSYFVIRRAWMTHKHPPAANSTFCTVTAGRVSARLEGAALMDQLNQLTVTKAEADFFAPVESYRTRLDLVIHDTCDTQKRTQLFNATPPVSSSLLDSLRDELTVVTAYFNLGKFPKASPHAFFTPEMYYSWMVPLSRIDNPMVAYFDKDNDIAYFKKLRAEIGAIDKTKIVKVDRRQLWSFGTLWPRIAHIYANREYPKHYPNTVVADYSCAMHAKYDVVQMAINNNYFNTRFFSWVDAGYFRDLGSNNVKPFTLYLPPNFNTASVAYGEVYNRMPTVNARGIFLSNHVWLCGGFFIGSVDVLSTWILEYKFYVEHFISQGLMDTDQQVVYSILNCHDTVTNIQKYRGNGRINLWFNLGFECKDEGEKRNALVSATNTSLPKL